MRGTPVSHAQRAICKEDLPYGLSSTKGFFSTKSWFKGQSTSARHSRSRSAPDNDFDLENWDLSPSNFLHAEIQQKGKATRNSDKRPAPHDHKVSLENDVADLHKRLRNERAVRNALEKAMGRASCAISPGHRHLTPQTKELISEITFLEEEVADLEQHVLSLYRSIFNRCLLRSSSIFRSKQKDESHTNQDQHRQQQQQHQEQSKLLKLTSKQKQNPRNQHRRHMSAATQGCSNSKIATSVIQPKARHDSIVCESLSIGGRSQISNSQALPQWKGSEEASMSCSISSKNDDGPRPLREYLSGTPNKLSEELVRCMTTIYCKLCDPPLPQFGILESPSSSSTSSSTLSSFHGIFSDGWSPGCKADLFGDAPLLDPFQVKGRSGNTGAYSCMVEVPWICVDKDRLTHAARMLRNFRSMVEQLEKVDPSHMNHDEKLAFWINIYNALLMHAYLAYGIPRNNLRRMTMLQRAAYKVGGHSINAHTIEHCILGCRSHRPTQWLQNLLAAGSKFKAGDERRAYSIDTPEPLVCFALCCGGRSDPAVRVYTPKHVHEELEIAKKEFLQASIGFQSDKKVTLPKLLEWYTREASISSNGLLDWVCQNVEGKEGEVIRKCMKSKPNKNCVEWVSYNFNFRYIFDRDLVTRYPSTVH